MAYNKIGWENGSIKKEGYVIIDGQTYQTVQPEYQGNTPVNAENLEHMDEGIEQAHKLATKSSILAYCSAVTTSSSTTVATKLPLSEQIKTGEKLNVSNNRVVANEDCTVLVSAQLYISGGITSTSTGVRSYIYKNGTEILRTIISVPNNYRMLTISDYMCELKAGDYLEIGFNSGDKTGIICGTGSDTYLTVLEV